MRKHIKEIIVGFLILLIIVEIGYIVKVNIEADKLSSMIQESSMTEDNSEKLVSPVNQKIIVLDPGHGKPSSLMTAEEKAEYGWIRNESGQWGEWRHYKTGSGTEDCEGSGCNGRVTPNGACWYPIENSDRNREPDINLQNALAAKKYLEARGYTVRMTRTDNEKNPSITKRLSYCFPENDPTRKPDAIAYICIHSNASGGGARGTAFITAADPYDQKWIKSTYTQDSNNLSRKINDKVVSLTSLDIHGNGEITHEAELIAFCKSPVTCAYLEIGFFDNADDLAILQSESENIGKAIAEGVDEFCQQR